MCCHGLDCTGFVDCLSFFGPVLSLIPVTCIFLTFKVSHNSHPHIPRDAYIVVTFLLSYTVLQCSVSVFYIYQSNGLRHGLLGHLRRVSAHDSKFSRKIDRLVRRALHRCWCCRSIYKRHSLLPLPCSLQTFWLGASAFWMAASSIYYIAYTLLAVFSVKTGLYPMFCINFLSGLFRVLIAYSQARPLPWPAS